MEVYYILVGIALLLHVMGIRKLLRLLFFRFAYPKATLKEIGKIERKRTSLITKVMHKIVRHESRN